MLSVVVWDFFQTINSSSFHWPKVNGHLLMDLMAPSKVTICGGSTTEGPMLCLPRSYRSPQPSWWWQWCHGSRSCWWCASRAIGKGRGGTPSKVAMLGWRASEWSIFRTKIGMQQTRGKEMYTSNHWHLTFRMTPSGEWKKIELSWLWTEISGKLCENGQTLEDLQALYKSFQDQPHGWISWMALSFFAERWLSKKRPLVNFLVLPQPMATHGHPLNFWGFNIR